MDDQRTDRESGGRSILRNLFNYAILPGGLLYITYDYASRALSERSYRNAISAIFYAIVLSTYAWREYRKSSGNKLNPTT
jgi:uncharacterized membrane-anchored protein